MADDLSDTFVMRSARAALTDGLAHIEEQVKAIERAVVENPSLAFDLARTIVESTCKTILSERKQQYSASDDLPKLFKNVTAQLPLLPTSLGGTASARKSLLQTLSGLHTALQGVCELRNAFGFASHGADGARPKMEAIQATLAAQAADAIIGFLHATHRQDQNTQRIGALAFEDQADFNEYVDDLHGAIVIFDAPYRASEVLFRVDQAAYRDALAGYQPLPAPREALTYPDREDAELAGDAKTNASEGGPKEAAE